MAFDITHKNLGRVKAGKRQEITYPYDSTVQAIGSIDLSCGCSGASHQPINREVVISYTPQPVPQHLRGQGHYYTRNHATVSVTLNTGDTVPLVLSFEATVYQ